MYYYWGFGLTIASELELPELLPWEYVDIPELFITIGITPATLTGSDVTHTPTLSVSPSQYLLKLFEIANYFAVNGNSIVIEPLSQCDERSLRLFLLNSVISAILYQRNNVMLHASAIRVEDGAVLFCGSTNSGKTTLVAALRQRGYKIFSDEVCLIKQSRTGVFEAIPSYPVYKLWTDTFRKMKIGLPDQQYAIRPGLGKYSIYYHKDFNTAAQPIKQVFVLRRNLQKKPISADALDPVEGFTRLHINTFYQSQIYQMKKQALSFSMISKLANVTPVFNADWYEGENSINMLCDLIEKNLLKHG